MGALNSTVRHRKRNAEVFTDAKSDAAYRRRQFRNHQLDGLRGFAAMAVVVFHAILGMDWTQIARIQSPNFPDVHGTYERLTKIAIAIFNGECAVVIFFVMSGAVLIQSLRRETAGDATVAMHFVIRRLLRVYPALIVCLLIALLLRILAGEPGTFGNVIVNLTLTDFPLIGPSWTLQVELLAVPLLLAGWIVFRRWKEAGLVFLTIAMLAVLRHTSLGRVAPHFTWFAICFAFGMFIPTAWGAWIARLTPRHAWAPLLLIALFAKHIVLFGGYSTTSTLQDVSAALLVNAVYHGRAAGLDRVLSTKFAGFYGRISYKLYLANAPILDITCNALSRFPFAVAHPLEFGLLLGPLFILVTTPVAYAITLFVEEPAIRLGRRLARPRKAQVAGAPATYPPLS